jgi:hypothetical protein
MDGMNWGTRKRTVRPIRVVIRTSRTASVLSADSPVMGHFSTVAAAHGVMAMVRATEFIRLARRKRSAVVSGMMRHGRPGRVIVMIPESHRPSPSITCPVSGHRP